MLAPVRRALVSQVRATFNDLAKGEKPVSASDEALFPPGSVIRRVHGDVTSMMVGGIAALLTQMLHPKALMNAAVDLMPGFAREMHRLSRPALPPVVRGATFGLARTLRWAFAGERYRRTSKTTA